MPVIRFLSRTGWVTGTVVTTLMEIQRGLNFIVLSAVIKERRMLFDTLPGWLWFEVEWQEIHTWGNDRRRRTGLHATVLRSVMYSIILDREIVERFIHAGVNICSHRCLCVWLRKKCSSPLRTSHFVTEYLVQTARCIIAKDIFTRKQLLARTA